MKQWFDKTISASIALKTIQANAFRHFNEISLLNDNKEFIDIEIF